MSDSQRKDASRPFEIQNIADHLDLIEQIAMWHWAEWGHADPGGSLATWTAGVRQHANRETIPTTFVALTGDELLGSVSLVEHDMSTRPDLSPWLGGMYVAPAYRGQGVGSALVRHAVHWAAAMKLPRLYLHTATAPHFYIQVGWLPIAETWYEGEAVTIMEIVNSDVVA